MSNALVPEKQVGPSGMGYAYLPTENGPKVGICVQHRADGTPRLVFDLTINYQGPQYGLPHARRLAVEFALDRGRPLPPDVGVLIGKCTWRGLEKRFQPPGSDPWLDPWRDWRIKSCPTTVWQRRETVSLLPWSVELRWPVLRAESGLMSPRTGIVSHELAVLNGNETVCMLDPSWLEEKKFGKLMIDSETTCFFPTPHSSI